MFVENESRPRGASHQRSARSRSNPGLRGGLASGLRRGLVLGTGAALTLGLLAGVTPSAPAGPDPSTLRPVAAEPAGPPLRTFSLNVKFSMGTWRARADMKRALTTLGASVGGFQEISQRVDRETLHGLLTDLGWGWYQPRGVPVPVVYDRDRFRLVAGRTIKVHGAEEGVTPSRYINVVRLRELATGRIFGVINTHTISGASRDAQASNMDRIPRLRRHIRMLRDEIVELYGSTEQVVAMGDLNVNYLADLRRQVWGLPTRVLGPVVNFDMPLVGSRGLTSLLDYTMSVQGGSLERTEGTIVRGFNSDHQAVVITYDVADVFATGPMPNGPGGAEARVVLDQWSHAISEAEPGTAVRVATPRITNAGIADDLLEAAARGVHVRVLLHRGAQTAQENRLAAALGGSASSSGVKAARTPSHASFLLVESAAGTTTLTLSTSAPVTSQATRSLADAYVSTDEATYTAFVRAFEALQNGGDVPSGRVTAASDRRVSVQFGPASADAPDPVARALRPIRCTGATSARTRDGKSQVRVAVRTWRGERGRALARQLTGKARWGCHVHVLAGPGVGPRVVKTLRRGRVAVRRAAVSQTLVLADGNYGHDGNAKRTWTGTGPLSDRGLRQASQTIRSSAGGTLAAYRQQFVRRWRQG